MKIDNIVKSLKRGVVNPVYLIHGKEWYLIDYLTRQFRRYLIKESLADFNYNVFDEKDINPQVIVNTANTPPVMNDKRLVIVKSKEIFKTDSDELIHYMDNPNESTCLLFSIYDKVDGRSKLYKKIKKSGYILKFDPLKDWEIPGWVEKHCSERGKNIEKQAANYLASTVGNNLSMLDKELQKIYSYVQDRKKITLDDVKAICSRTLSNNIFELVDALVEGDNDKTIFYLRDMLLAGEPEIRILFMIIRQYRLMLQAKILQSKGHNVNTLPRKTGWHPYVAKKVLKQSQRYTVEELESCLRFLSQLDFDLKTSKTKPAFLLETNILKLVKNQ